MLLAKVLDILGALVYIFLVFLGFYLGFKRSFKIFLFIVFITIINSLVFKIFKYFIVQEYLQIIDVGVIFGSSVLSFFIVLPLVNKISEAVPSIDLVIVDRMVGFLLFIVNGIFLIGYFVIFADFLPPFYYLLDTSGFLRVLSNIVKFIIGVKLF